MMRKVQERMPQKIMQMKLKKKMKTGKNDKKYE